MKTILKITAGILLAFAIMFVGCAALISGGAQEVEKEMNETRDRWDQQERDYYACAETLDISDPHYLTKLDECSNGLYR